MFFFIVRRLLVSVPILLAASFAMFGMVTISGDPLAEFRQSTDPNAPQTMATMRQILDLDKPFTERYVDWLGGLFQGDFGLNRDGELQYRGRLDDAGMKPADNRNPELINAMRQIARTGQGPRRQIPSMGCSIKWS